MSELISGNIFIREGVLKDVGNAVVGHAHNFDHTTYVPRGALRIDKLDGDDGAVVESVELHATHGRNWALIEAGRYHRLTALEPGTVYHCIYSHRTPQGDIVQVYDGWPKGLS